MQNVENPGGDVYFHSNMKIKILKVTKRNLKDLEELCIATQSALVPIKNQQSREKDFAKYVDDPRFIAYLLYYDNKAIVYQTIDLRFRKNTVRMRGLAVRKEFRKKGYGTKLLRFCLKRLRSEKKFKEAVTRTWSKNTGAIRMIESAGFRKYKTIKKQRMNGADTYWYRLNFKEMIRSD